MKNNDRKYTMRTPLVSVIMAIYNERPDIVKAAIKSILEQDYENIELLIADDSTQRLTIEAVDSFASDDRIVVIRQKERMGVSHSRNACLDAAKGEYIAIMDGDDISLSDRLKRQVRYMEGHKKVYVLGGQINIIDEDSKMVSFRKYPSGRISLFLFSIIRCPVAQPAVMMRRELVDKGFRYDENLAMAEDLDLWLRIMNQGYRVTNLNETVLNYRIGKSFIERRTDRAQVRHVAEARRKNFSWKRPLYSILSCSATWLFLNMPAGVIRRFYQSENGKRARI